MAITIDHGILQIPGAQDKLRQKGREHPGFYDDYTMIDIETTGLAPYRDRITDLGAVKVRQGQVVDTYSTLVKYPGNNRVPAFITKLNGITQQLLEDEGKPVKQAIAEFRDFIGSDLIAGYNVNFDLNFVYDACEKFKAPRLDNDYIDVLRLARGLYPRQRHNRLVDLLQRLNIAQTEEHRGLQDSMDTIRVYNELQKLAPANLEEELTQQLKTVDLSQPLPTSRDLVRFSQFDHKRIVLAGDLASGRSELGQALSNLGADLREEVNPLTDYVIAGDREFFKGDLPAIKAARSLQAEHNPIKCWTESFFLAVFDDWARR
ncbi:exonuclease domain-containing protein [Lactobacillus corticis]|uniref:DNA polymerase III polC-type n=1 Tax=Lactobacillus corticis TaxID=2201249 RepID=A0A916VH88_9LACO|nr:exonuclease domain-containing protein [Lactobacillus corticis]GFZ26776.1 3'-5' exonuclease [Lactobacillus corticis]